MMAFGFLALARFPRAIGVTARRARLGIAASATALFLVLLSTGTHLPGALVFDPLYQLPLGWLLREPGRFLILGGLAYSVLLALTTEAVLREAELVAGHRVALALSFASPGTSSRGGGRGGRGGARAWVPAHDRSDRPRSPSGAPLDPRQRARVLDSDGVLPERFRSIRQSPRAPRGRLLPDALHLGLLRSGQLHHGPDSAKRGGPGCPRLCSPPRRSSAGAVGLVQQGLLAHDWPSVQRTLTAIGTPLLLVRGDVNAAFPGRHITPPAALERALREDKDMRLVRRFGKLELFALRTSISPAGSVTRYATVNSATPDLRDLALLPSGTALISSPMRPAVPAVLQVPPVSQWQLVGDELETSVVEPPGRRYNIKLLSATGAFERPGASSRPPARLIARVRHRDGQAVEELSYKLGGSLLSDGDFVSGTWGAVGNCAAFPGTAATARLAARVLPGQGPAGLPALALSAKADSACEARPLAWRSGPLFVSLWVRNVSGARTADLPLGDAYRGVRRHVAAPAELIPFPLVPLPGDRDT